MIINILKDVIKSGAILGFFIVIMIPIGFVSRFAEGRVLGFSFENLSVNSYLEHSGKFILQTLQAVYIFPFYTEYINIKFLLLVIILITILIYIIPFDKVPLPFFYKIYKIIKTEKCMRLFCIINILIFYILLLNIFIPFIHVKSVIQPTTMSELMILKKSSQILTYSKENSFKYSKLIDKYVSKKFCNCQDNKNTNRLAFCLFNWKSYNNTNKRKNTYITIVHILLCLLVLFILISKIIKKYSVNWQKKMFKMALYYLFFCIIILSFLHGVLGLDYSYPVVNIKFKNGQSINGVFLINKNSQFINLLNRKNYLTINKLFLSNDILSIDQKFSASPFKNCNINSKGKIILCEEKYW